MRIVIVMKKKTFRDKVEPIIALIVLCLLLIGFGVVTEYNEEQENIVVNTEQE